jgi:hypothetical protein
MDVLFAILLIFSLVFTSKDYSLKVIRSAYRPKLAVTRHKFIEIALEAVLSAPIGCSNMRRLPTLLNDASRFSPLSYLRHFWYNNPAWLRSLAAAWQEESHVEVSSDLD